MKRTVLIPLLLSTFLLVGCETEREFDRCFEANGGNAEFDKAPYDVKVEMLRLVPEDTALENFIEVFEKQERIFKSSLTDIELEFYNCGLKKYSERNKELKDSGMDALERLENIDDDEITNLCLPKNRAKQICNSQGIY